MTIDRVLVAIDFSTRSLDAARWVARHFAPSAEIVLAHVIALPPPPKLVQRTYPRHDLLMETLREGATRRLNDLRQSLLSDRVRAEVREGPPAETLDALAHEVGASIIVIGAHGERPDDWESLGSTAEQVIMASHVPVLVAERPRPNAPTEIAVAVDDSDLAPELLAIAGDLSRRFKAHVTTIHVVPTSLSDTALAAAEVMFGTPPVYTRDLLPASSHDTSRWMESARDAGIAESSVSSSVSVGVPAAEILDAAERIGADLIVLGRRRRGGLRRALLGSVAMDVLRRAPCPVLVLAESSNHPHTGDASRAS